MPNYQMPNYGVKTHYVSIRSTSYRNVNKSEKNQNNTDRTALFISKPVKCQQQRVNKEETIKRYGKRRKEIREEKKRDKGREE